MIRCYGKTSKSDWDITFEKIQKFASLKKVGKYWKPTISGEKCSQGFHISAEASVLPGKTNFVFRSRNWTKRKALVERGL